LWSYLRRFPALSEEMTQSHRIDLLSDALLYYPIYKNDSMGWYDLLLKLHA